jgi:hypothetical protein
MSGQSGRSEQGNAPLAEATLKSIVLDKAAEVFKKVRTIGVYATFGKTSVRTLHGGRPSRASGIDKSRIAHRGRLLSSGPQALSIFWKANLADGQG